MRLKISAGAMKITRKLGMRQISLIHLEKIKRKLEMRLKIVAGAVEITRKLGMRQKFPSYSQKI